MIKFTEWVNQQNVEDDDQLIENQLSQWVTRLAGLLQNIDEEKKQQLLSRVVNSIKEI